MISHIIKSLALLSIITLGSQAMLAKTLNGETSWEQTKYCSEGDNEDKIVMYRYYDDDSYDLKYVTRQCDEDCWEETPWSNEQNVSGVVIGLPSSIDGSGNWILYQAQPGTGGMFTEGSGATCRGFVSDPQSSTIFVPAALVDDNLGIQ